MQEPEDGRSCIRGADKSFVREDDICSNRAEKNDVKRKCSIFASSFSKAEEFAWESVALYVTKYVSILNEDDNAKQYERVFERTQRMLAESAEQEEAEKSRLMSACLTDKSSNIMGIPLGAWLSRCDGRVLLKHICAEWRLMVLCYFQMYRMRRDTLESSQKKEQLSVDGSIV